jgi:hypothetical protein
MKIEWGVLSAFNMGRIPETDYRIERSRSEDRKTWGFCISNDEQTYLHVDDRQFNSMEEMTTAIFNWIDIREKYENV